MTFPLVDIGVNLTNKAFDKDRDATLQRALAAGVHTLILTGTSLRGSLLALDYAKTSHALYSTAGVHPHDAKDWKDGWGETFRELYRKEKVVAVGECGLDFNRDFSPRPVQEEIFERQIQLAVESGLPLFLHERDAHQRFLEILRPHRDKLSAAVVHCFTGTDEEMRAYLDLDLHIGITGWICDERRGLHLRELIREIPDNRLMLETDAPYLVPRDLRPKPKKGRNEPAFLAHILQTVANCLDKTPEEVAASTTSTAKAFFQIG